MRVVQSSCKIMHKLAVASRVAIVYFSVVKDALQGCKIGKMDLFCVLARVPFFHYLSYRWLIVIAEKQLQFSFSWQGDHLAH